MTSVGGRYFVDKSAYKMYYRMDGKGDIWEFIDEGTAVNKRMVILAIGLFVMVGLGSFTSYVSAAPAEVFKDIGFCTNESESTVVITHGKNSNFLFSCKGVIDGPKPERVLVIRQDCVFLPGTPKGGVFVVHPDGKIIVFCKNRL